GTTISANAAMNGSESSLYSDQYSGIVGLSLTQSLLQGFGTGVNLASLQKANIDVEISEAELKAVAEQVTANVETAYWGLYLAHEEINIRQSSLELAEKQLQESLERVSVGILPDLELAAVHAEVATRKGDLIDSQSRYEQARLHFLFLLNPEGEDIWSTVPILLDEPFIPADTLDVISVHEELGMLYRPDLQQARLALKKGELDIVQTKNGLLPRLDLLITFGRTTYAQTFNEAVPDPQSPFYDMNVGFNFSFPVTIRKARAQYARAQRSQKQMEMSVQNMERLAQSDIRSAYVEVMRSRQQIEATRVTDTLQEQKLEAEEEKFRVDKSTNYLVLQAQRDFTSSQLDEARAMVSYLNALVNLYVMEGTLMDRRSIKTTF
ncbi:MAG TPA: TolC family protein, partial [Anaerolineae bacterium]|nr:TolC family protein [Anaerolineae bacterium]